MRAITGAVVSSKPCTLTEAHDMLSALCSSRDSYLESSDCATYILALDGAIKEQHKFLRSCGRGEQQQGAAHHDARRCEAPLDGVERRGDTKVSLPGPHGSIEDAEVAVAAVEKKSKKLKNEVEPRDDKAEAGIPSHAPASPELLFEQRKKKDKEKHSIKELVSVVKQEPDLVGEEDVGSERNKKKKDKHSDKELARVVKQEPDLVGEEDVGSERKNKKKKDKHSDKELAIVVKQEPDLVVEEEAKKKREKGHVQGVADEEKKRKKKKHSKEEGDSKGVKEEEDKMAIDTDANSEEKKKKKKKRARGDDDDDVEEQGKHKKKKQRNESR